MNNYIMYESGTTLAHYGVKGMKWGVRRYQNYDGSYTRAGMKRFNKSLDTYEKADARYKAAKKGTDKVETTNARLARKRAKHQVNKDYKHLKQDKLADQGKELYSKGETITRNNNVMKILGNAGATAFSMGNLGSAYGIIQNEKVAQYLKVSGVLAMSVSGMMNAANRQRARQLRAYYSHTSNY